MARRPQPGGDRNAWGGVMNEHLAVSLNPDGTIKANGVQDAVTTGVETAMSVQLTPAIADALAEDETVAAAAAAAVDAEPRVSQLITDVDDAGTAIARVDPGVSADPSSFAANIAGQMTWVKMPYIDPTMTQFGMKESNTDLENGIAMNAAMSAAFEAGAVLRIPPGTFNLRRVQPPSGLVIEGAGSDRTKFVRSVNLSGHAAVFDGWGSAGPAIPFAAATVRNATSFTVATNPNLVPGDVVFVSDNREPWAGTMPGKAAVSVIAVSGTGPYTVHLGDALYHPFDTALGATMRKVTPWSGGLHGFTIENTSGAAKGIHLSYAGPRAEVGDVQIEKWTTSALLLDSSYKSRVDRVGVADPTSTIAGSGYGIRLDLGTRGVDVGHSWGRHARHSFDISMGSSDNIVHDSYGYDPVVGPDFITHGVECYHNQFVACTANAPGVNMGFNAGNNSFGGDYYTLFDRCIGIGSGPTGAENGMFRSINGSTGTRWTNCTVLNGYYGYLVRGSSCTISGGRTVNVADGVYILGASGTTVTGHRVDTATVSGVRSLGISNYTMVTSNQFLGCPSPAVQLAGTGNVVASNTEY